MTEPISSQSNPVKVQEEPLTGETDGIATTKSAAKKEAKRAQALAKAAAKVSATPPPAATPSEKKIKKEKAVPLSDEVFVNTTPAGDKKDLSGEMASGYNPIAVEAAWNAWWEREGFFEPEFNAEGGIKEEGLFVVPAPPPNVTGALHNGHALTIALQDCLIRWNRMLGKTVLFNPGYDHAGISTQTVVEKRLYKTTGKTRHDLGREKFLEMVWEWKETYQATISNQLKRLGASYDWNRVAFTMDERLSKAVVETFCTLHSEGLIYRANRLVNWCVYLNTTLSNIECEGKQLTGRTLMSVPGYDPKEKFEFGVLTSFAYPIEGSDEKVVVATTRPETMLGDTGIAVHPDDPRYKHLHGKFAAHPFLSRRIPIVLDPILVDMEFGTGAVKVTPAHDPNDFKCGERNGLEFINILNDNGTFNENAGAFKGMKRYHARNAVVEALKEKGLYVDAVENPMTIQLCAKSGDVIEQIMKPQWWVNCQPLAAGALRETNKGNLTIKPPMYLNEWQRWLAPENIQDWCISRQLWWGHRCPAYFVKIDGKEGVDTSDDHNWIVARTREEAEKLAKERFPSEKFVLEQDEDVLDTWFSSGLWPFSIMGWPDNTPDFQHFYPSSLLETGGDILFFWVARMVMLGVHLTGRVPFGEVYCHAMVRDAHGRKMSKSLGNVINPIDVIEGISLEDLHKKLEDGNLDKKEIEKAKQGQKIDFPNGIPQCGTDALRFALCAYTSGGRDINLEILRVEGYRKFCNKLWNATKFAMLKLSDDFVPSPSHHPSGNESLVERWILDKLNKAAIDINKDLESRNFQSATTAAYNFWLYELCDVYIEAMKPLAGENAPAEGRRSAQNTLYTCLDQGLRLLHPFMPFVTEELWQRLPRRPNDSTPTISKARFPVSDDSLDNPSARKDFDLTFACAERARSLAGAYKLQTNLQIFITCLTPAAYKILETQAPTIVALIKGAKSVEVGSELSKVPDGCASEAVGADIVVNLLIKGLVNVDGEISKAEKRIQVAQMGMDKIQKHMADPGYDTKIAESVRLNNAEKIKELEAEIATLRLSIDRYSKLR